MPAVDDLLLTTEELRLRTQKRRRVLVIVLMFVVLLVIAVFSARPASHAIKAWQARRHAQRAFIHINNEHWNEAHSEAIAAYQLSSTEPQALRAVARFLTRIRQAEALEFWKQLDERHLLTPEDRRDEATIALTANDLLTAETAVNDLLARKDFPASAADFLLAAQVAVQKGASDEAKKFAQKVLEDASADERTQYQAAILIIAVASHENLDVTATDAAWARLKKLAEGKTQVSLEALAALARHAASVSTGSTDPVGTHASDLIRAIETHPLATTAHKLFAFDLRMHFDPSERDSLIARAIADWKDGDAVSLTALTAWLNSKGEYQKTLDTIPLEKALQTRDLFLQHLDALGALNRWEEIKHLLNAEKFPLDQVAQQMYLARCNGHLGEKTAAENNWQRALELAKNEAPKLVALADYAQKNGVTKIAETAYTTATNSSPKLRAAWYGRLRLAQISRDTKNIHAILAEMLKIWPNDLSIQNDEAHMRLLLMPSLQSQENSGSRGANFTAGGREDSANRPREAGDSVLGKSEDRKKDREVGAIDPNRPELPKPSTITKGQSGRRLAVESSDQSSTSAELQSLEQLAETLVKKNPASFPHRTLLALARLRQNRTDKLAEVYANLLIKPNTVTASALAVHSAAMAAIGQLGDARKEAQQIKADLLLPEERDLIEQKIGH